MGRQSLKNIARKSTNRAITRSRRSLDPDEISDEPEPVVQEVISPDEPLAADEVSEADAKAKTEAADTIPTPAPSAPAAVGSPAAVGAPAPSGPPGPGSETCSGEKGATYEPPIYSKGEIPTPIDWTKTSDLLPNLEIRDAVAKWDGVYEKPTLPAEVTWTVCPTEGTLHLAPIRCRMLDIGRAYIGKITDVPSGETKTGWELLMDIYSTSYHDKMEGGTCAWANFPADIKANAKKPNSWCGIFDVAVAFKGGIKSARWLRWDFKTENPKRKRFAMPDGLFATSSRGSLCQPITAENVPVPGDILIVKDDPAKPPLNHHCMVEAVTETAYKTIDGNSGGMNQVNSKERAKDTISCFYRVIEDTWMA